MEYSIFSSQGPSLGSSSSALTSFLGHFRWSRNTYPRISSAAPRFIDIMLANKGFVVPTIQSPARCRGPDVPLSLQALMPRLLVNGLSKRGSSMEKIENVCEEYDESSVSSSLIISSDTAFACFRCCPYLGYPKLLGLKGRYSQVAIKPLTTHQLYYHDGNFSKRS